MNIDTDGHGEVANRRGFLKAVGALGAVGLAGCGGDGDDTDEPTDTEPGDTTEPMDTTEPADTTEPGETTADTETETPTATETPEQPLDDPAALLEFPADLQAQPGTTVTVSGTVTNPYLFDVLNVEVAMEASGDATVEAASGTSFGTLETQATEPAEWELTVPESAEGEIDLTATVTYESTTDEAEVEATSSVVVIGPVPVPFGINPGGVQGSEETVEIDGVEFLPYTSSEEPPHPSVSLLVNSRGQSLHGGADAHEESSSNPDGAAIDGGPDDIYNTMLWGDNIGYEIPVNPGTYEVTLHLAEINFEAEGERIYSVFLQDEAVFEELDLVAEVGPLTALTETVEVEVDGDPIRITSDIADGSEDDHTMFNAIEIREA